MEKSTTQYKGFLMNLKRVFKTTYSKDELYIRDIVEGYLSDKEVKKMVTPISGVCYLHDKKSGTKIKLHGSNIDICNSTFLYKKDISGNMATKLHKAIRDKVEEELLELDKELFMSEIDLLGKILKDKA